MRVVRKVFNASTLVHNVRFEIRKGAKIRCQDFKPSAWHLTRCHFSSVQRPNITHLPQSRLPCPLKPMRCLPCPHIVVLLGQLMCSYELFLRYSCSCGGLAGKPEKRLKRPDARVGLWWKRVPKTAPQSAVFCHLFTREYRDLCCLHLGLSQ